MKRRIVYFVVLHYQTIKETEECVQTLLNQKSKEIAIRIIIVDNASPNNSGNILKSLYFDNNQVTVICNSRNLGYAKGNNVGFGLAKKKGADYIVLINNDTLIKDAYFVNNIDMLYNKYHFGVLGPDILSVNDKVHQNPMAGFNITVCTLCMKIVRSYLIRILNWTGIYSIIWKRISSNKSFNAKYTTEHIIDTSNEVLHGSCLVFSKDFISKFDGLFDKTFLYFEEYILAYICRKNNISMLYSPLIQIEHYRGISTKYEIKNQQNKTEFFHKETIYSLKAFLKYVIKSGN